MVYAVRSDRPMVTSKPLKKTRKKNGQHERIKKILSQHNTELSGKISVK